MLSENARTGPDPLYYNKTWSKPKFIRLHYFCKNAKCKYQLGVTDSPAGTLNITVILNELSLLPNEQNKSNKNVRLMNYTTTKKKKKF